MTKNVKIGMLLLAIVVLGVCAKKEIIEYVFAANKNPTRVEETQAIEQTNSKGETEGRIEQQEVVNPIYIVQNKIFHNGNKEKKQIALTFDDGPSKYYTEKVLDILKQYEVKATFFVIGRHIERYPQELVLMSQQGHEIANHSFNHKNFNKLTKAEIEEELIQTQKILDDTIGNHTNIFRPPYGAMGKNSLEAVNALGYNVVNWSVDTRDWSGIPVENIMEKVKQQLHSGGIILMHSSGKKKAMENMLIALPQIIEWAKMQGYEFTTVSQLLEFQGI
ncbi:polysaccharide deacetylase family protein [Inediibacterium massiliense]|uniref:polysaccharide deacetylase family protein n=1 Tax=Inediibacterium massiliense TaxID=1658111 RepID=UPI0006B4F93A|nr:polysaccharide deacetylase family protein [Inediibacterium massiliense]